MSEQGTTKDQVADDFLAAADAEAGKLSYDKPHPRDYGGEIVDCVNGPRWSLPDGAQRGLFYLHLSQYWRWRAVSGQSSGIDTAIEATTDVRLPCDVRVGAGTVKRNVPVSTLLRMIKNHIGYAQEPGYPFTDGYLDKRPVISGVVGCSICHGSGFDVTGKPCPMVHMHRTPQS
jgi:hypothetical protein